MDWWDIVARTLAEEFSDIPDLDEAVRVGTRLLLATAEADTDEFKRQSLDYAAACKAGACEVRYLEVSARNHFDVIMDWMDADAALTQHTWSLID